MQNSVSFSSLIIANNVCPGIAENWHSISWLNAGWISESLYGIYSRFTRHAYGCELLSTSMIPVCSGVNSCLLFLGALSIIMWGKSRSCKLCYIYIYTRTSAIAKDDFFFSLNDTSIAYSFLIARQASLFSFRFSYSLYSWTFLFVLNSYRTKL